MSISFVSSVSRAALWALLVSQSIHTVSALVLGRQDFLQLLRLLPLLEVPTTLLAPNAPPAFPDAKITDKIFMDIRVSRQDGSFYVRDDLPDTFENRVLSTRLEFGLFGNLAPNHVQKFLSYVISSQDEDVNNPLPSYSRSTFVSLDQSTGLLQGGNVPSLRVSDIGGSIAIQYGSRVLPANLWLDPFDGNTKLSHSCKGLLTHRTLDVTPAFGITTRAASSSLDATHTVFGQVLWNDKTAQFWNQLQDLPTYSLERAAAYEDPTGVANTVFNAQREFFRGAAKNLGDTRVGKVYEGKLLRRMEVTQVGRV
jgi:cyclophilin family peptidyl-prolyl cis-trans isomerase